MVTQHKSTRSRDVEQLSLLPSRKPCPPPDLDYVKALPNFRRAMRYAISLADLEPKQVYGPLDKDKATWSRIEGGDMSFPVDDLIHFCAVVDNDVVLMWLLASMGYDLSSIRKLQDDKDKRIAELELALRKSEEDKQVIAKFVKESLR